LDADDVATKVTLVSKMGQKYYKLF